MSEINNNIVPDLEENIQVIYNEEEHKLPQVVSRR
jgi:hypothetical protein